MSKITYNGYTLIHTYDEKTELLLSKLHKYLNDYSEILLTRLDEILINNKEITYEFENDPIRKDLIATITKIHALSIPTITMIKEEQNETP